MVRVSKTMANSYSWQKNRKTRKVTAREKAAFNKGLVNNVIGKFDGFDEEALKKPEGERPNGINKSSNKGLSKNALWSAEMVKHAQQYVEKGIPIDEFSNVKPAKYGGETMMQVRQNVEEFIIESIVEQELEGIEEELTEDEALTIEEIEELDEIVMEYHETSGLSTGMDIPNMDYFKIVLESKNWDDLQDALLWEALEARANYVRFRCEYSFMSGLARRVDNGAHMTALVFPSEMLGAIDASVKDGRDWEHKDPDGFMTHYSMCVVEELAHFANWEYDHEKYPEMDRVLKHGDVT